jgi:hypothetical protein
LLVAADAFVTTAVRRRIHVRESVKGPLKDKDSRVVPILDRLLPVLADWKLRTGGEGRVIPPLRSDGQKIDKGTPGTYLRLALDELSLARDGLRWYQATRHTFASQWVMNGGSIEKLKEILGHYLGRHHRALRPPPAGPLHGARPRDHRRVAERERHLPGRAHAGEWPRNGHR